MLFNVVQLFKHNLLSNASTVCHHIYSIT